MRAPRLGPLGRVTEVRGTSVRRLGDDARSVVDWVAVPSERPEPRVPARSDGARVDPDPPPRHPGALRDSRFDPAHGDVHATGLSRSGLVEVSTREESECAR